MFFSIFSKGRVLKTRNILTIGDLTNLWKFDGRLRDPQELFFMRHIHIYMKTYVN